MQKGQTAWLRHRQQLEKKWRLADARGQVLGRLASQIAKVLMGKHKPTALDNLVSGDAVIVINARHFALTGRKKYNKEYIHHSGYPGGLKRVPIHEVMEKRPQDALRLAVKNMLPSNKLRDRRLDNLIIYLDEEHNYHHMKPMLLPPADVGLRLGTGGPPTIDEMEQWWLTHLSHCPDKILEEIMAEVKDELKPRSLGLAEVLEFGKQSDPSAEDVEAVRMYIESVNKEELENPVVLPPS